MNETNNLKLNKPEKTDFVSIGSFNENSDKIDALGAPEFDDSGTVNGITDFTTYLSTLVSGTSIFNFFRNLKAGFQYVLHVGQLVNNTVTNNDNLPASASAVYKLQQSLNTTNSNLINVSNNINGMMLDGSLPANTQKSNVNMDTVTQNGFYTILNATNNSPFGDAFGLIVVGNSSSNNTNVYCAQIAYQFGTGGMKIRTKAGSSGWTDWKSISTT